MIASYHNHDGNIKSPNRADVNEDNKQTFEAEISTITECDSSCSIVLFQTVTESSIVNFP